MSRNSFPCISDAAFQADAQQLLCFDGEFHGQLAEDALAEAVDDHGDGVFGLEPALAEVEHLVLADLRRGGFVLHARRRILHFDIRERVRAALVADQQRIALGVVPRARGVLHDLHLAAVGVLAVAGGDALGNDGAARVLADVNHLRAGVGLLIVVGERDGIEFADGIVALQNAARILPGDGRAGFDLRPGNLRILAATRAALGDEIVDAALAVLVAGIPVLHGGVFDLRVVERDQFNDRGVQLIFIADRRGAALEIAHGSAFVGNDQSALELARLRGINAEVGGQLHGALDALWARTRTNRP